MDPADLDRKIRSAFGPRSLGAWPTPLEASPALGARTGADEIWIKREDRASARYGGNKVRGLEFLFAALARGDAVVTLGGWGSTHCLATARHGRALGAHVVIAQFPQGQSDGAEAAGRATKEAATACFRARSWATVPVAWARAWLAAGRLGPRRVIPGGGAAPVAVLGHALATLELAGQLPAPPDAIVTPLGTGGTAAGILLGCGLLGWKTRVYAVRVAPRVVANAGRVRRLSAGAGRLLTDRRVLSFRAPAVPSLVVVDGVGGGYGYPTAAGEAARAWAREAGFETDSTYGGKALAALPQAVRAGGRRVVYWHTYAAPGPETGGV